jgi:hypothetical protein
MDALLKEWKREVDRLWSDATINHAAALRLATEIVRQGKDPMLREAAKQSLFGLRAACAKRADRRSKEIADRGFGAVRNCLYALSGPRFGKRMSAQEMLEPDAYYRHLLGLPLERRLFGPEIQQAYKRRAKTAHPDGGGNQRAFLDLVAARDALLKSV